MFRTALHLTDDQHTILADLGRHPAWPVLRGVVKDKMEQEFLLLSKSIMRGEPVEAAHLAWKRGFFAGMKFVLDNPTAEAKKFEKALNERGDE